MNPTPCRPRTGQIMVCLNGFNFEPGDPPSGGVESVTVANIDDPAAELVLLTPTGKGQLITVNDGFDSWTMYISDASGESINSPYVCASGATAFRWSAIAGRYTNQDSVYFGNETNYDGIARFNAGQSASGIGSGSVQVTGGGSFTGKLWVGNFDSAGTVDGAIVRATSYVQAKGLLVAIVGKAANYTATASDYEINVNAAPGAVTITLPNPSGAGIDGTRYLVRKTDASANAVTVGATVDGVANPTIGAQYGKIHVTAYVNSYLSV